MLAEEVLSALAKGLPGSTSGPERRAVAATAGAIRRRPMRAHAQRQRLRTTRAAARPSEEQEDEESHADSCFVLRAFSECLEETAMRSRLLSLDNLGVRRSPAVLLLPQPCRRSVCFF